MARLVRIAVSAAALMTALSRPGVAYAQEAATLEQLRTAVRPGEIIYITDTSGRETKARLRTISSSSLELVTGTTLLDRDIRRIRVERNDPVWRGALIGLAAAGGPWLFVCASTNDWCEYGEYGAENLYRNVALITTAMGAGLGALIDRSIKAKVTVYRAPGGAIAIHVTPIAAASSAGVKVSARF